MLNLCIKLNYFFFPQLFLGFQDFENENCSQKLKLEQTKNILTKVVTSVTNNILTNTHYKSTLQSINRKLKDGFDTCSKLLGKNNQERLDIANQIWKKSKIETSETENGFKCENCKIRLPPETELSQHALTCGKENSEDNIGL